MAETTKTVIGTRVGPVPVRTVGDGPPILAVHGVLADSRLWDGVAERLAPRARVVLPDLPLGSHRVAVPDRRRLNPLDLAGALTDLLDGLGLGTAVLLGNDSGGGLSQMAATLAPDRFPGLALTSCDALEHNPPVLLRPLMPLLGTPRGARLLARAFTLPALLMRPGPLNLLTRRPVDPGLVRDWMRPAVQDPAICADLAAYLRSVSPAYTLAAARRLRDYPGPVVLAWSRGDRFFPRRDAERLAAAAPRGRLTWIEDALTFSPLDRPDAVATAAAEVLDDLAAHPSRYDRSARVQTAL